MTFASFAKKLRAYIWARIVRYTRSKSYYHKIYRSYWHKRHKNSLKQEKNNPQYFSAVPHPGAGIGHQMANWIAGFWFAKRFNLIFAHIPFSSNKWEYFLGFGEGESKLDELIRSGYKKVLIPLFNENNEEDTALIKEIIKSYEGNGKIVFIAEQDQFYADQFGVIEEIKHKFYSSSARKDDKLIFSKDHFNVVIHVRRGDIAPAQKMHNLNLAMRWQDNQYFESVLANVIENIDTEKPVSIYLMSQGIPADFTEFEKFSNIRFCLNMNPVDSFLHMVYADILITSKSSFSYKPALLSNGLKVCPRNFWHGYPKSAEWILADEAGNFDVSLLNIATPGDPGNK